MGTGSFSTVAHGSRQEVTSELDKQNVRRNRRGLTKSQIGEPISVSVVLVEGSTSFGLLSTGETTGGSGGTGGVVKHGLQTGDAVYTNQESEIASECNNGQDAVVTSDNLTEGTSITSRDSEEAACDVLSDEPTVTFNDNKFQDVSDQTLNKDSPQLEQLETDHDPSPSHHTDSESTEQILFTASSPSQICHGNPCTNNFATSNLNETENILEDSGEPLTDDSEESPTNNKLISFKHDDLSSVTSKPYDINSKQGFIILTKAYDVSY